MNAVIIGGGWLGLPLAESLAKQQFLVTMTYRSKVPEITQKVALETYDGTVVSQSLQQRLAEADVVFFTFPPPKDGSSHAAQCLTIAKHAPESCRFVFTSTTGVYPNEDKNFTENMVIATADSENKHLRTEFELRDALKERLTIVRMAGLVGGGRFPVKNMSASGKVYNGSEVVNLIHQIDAVRVLEFVATSVSASGGTLNACVPSHPDKQSYYTWMAEQLGIDPPKFEKGPTGKCIQSDLLDSYLFSFERPNPYDFVD